jgi:hypothetical protein
VDGLEDADFVFADMNGKDGRCVQEPLQRLRGVKVKNFKVRTCCAKGW